MNPSSNQLLKKNKTITLKCCFGQALGFHDNSVFTTHFAISAWFNQPPSIVFQKGLLTTQLSVSFVNVRRIMQLDKCSFFLLFYP